MPPMHLDQAFANRQTKAQSSIATRGGTLRLPELIEDQFLFFERDPQAGVADLNSYHPVIGANDERDLTLRRKLDRIMN